jgi:transcriptional regulator with XRE-family HTH domain
MKLSKTIIAKAKKLFDKSGMTLEELGEKMGHESETARQKVWLLFNRTTDLRVSTVERLADALGVKVKDLF